MLNTKDMLKTQVFEGPSSDFTFYILRMLSTPDRGKQKFVSNPMAISTLHIGTFLSPCRGADLIQATSSIFDILGGQASHGYSYERHLNIFRMRSADVENINRLLLLCRPNGMVNGCTPNISSYSISVHLNCPARQFLLNGQPHSTA